MSSAPIEAECKFRVLDAVELERRLNELNATFVGEESHRDTYFRHPCRDFRTTDEALRVREVNGVPFLTYKGPRRAGPLKIRPEIELGLAPENRNEWMQIWEHLGFAVVATVEKSRRIFKVDESNQALTVTIDQVPRIGTFTEIERIVFDQKEIDAAQSDIFELAKRLGLGQIEKRSYLGLLLERST